MRVKTLVIIMIALVVTACSNTSTEAPDPTTAPNPTAEATAATADTAAPIETSPLPTRRPKTGKELPPDAFETLIYAGEQFLEDWHFLAARVFYTEMLAYDLDAPQEAFILSRRAFAYDSVGDFENAIRDYTDALELQPDEPALSYRLCWDYAITNRAQSALPHCENAVRQYTAPNYVDARGVTYALLGRYKEATADFETVAAYLEDNIESGTEATLDTRLEWISELEAGNNPITPQALIDLQNEFTVYVKEAPVYTPEEIDLSRAAIKTRLEEKGFVFDALETKNGKETLSGRLQEGSCVEDVDLVGPEAEIDAFTLSIIGCENGHVQGELYWFIAQFFTEREALADAPWAAKLVFWTTTDLYYVTQGATKDEISKDIEDITFTAISVPILPNSLKITATINR
ncbi:MAG: tetratricopeptide repeat protein [Anaerolineales bacterium]|jgi:tetratricopeptide (TPR) repeat protein